MRGFRLLLLIAFIALITPNIFSQPLVVETMPSWGVNHSWGNAMINDSIILWGTAFGGTPPYQDSLLIDGIWLPDMAPWGDPFLISNDGYHYLYNHYFARKFPFTSCGFHSVTLKVTDALGATASSSSLILVHYDPTFEVKVNVRIERALLYLYKNTLNYNVGSNNYIVLSGHDYNTGYTSDEYGLASTGGAIMAMEENGRLGSNPVGTDPYSTFVKKGLEYLLSVSGQMPISNHSDGLGLKISDLFTSNITGSPNNTGNLRGSYVYNANVYANAFGLLAIILSQRDSIEAQNNIITTGSFHYWTYDKFVRDNLDFLYNCQGDNLVRGGWYYNLTPPTPSSFDGSIEQWPVLAMIGAEKRLGLKAPQWVRTNVVYCYSTIHNVNGGCGYSSTFSENTAKTGGMLAAYAWAHKYADSADVDAISAVNYVKSKYMEAGGFAGSGWAGSFYAMYAIKKGLSFQLIKDLTIGTDTREVYKDFVAWLTGQQLATLPASLAIGQRNLAYCYGQHPDGSWTDSDWLSSSTNLATAHGILIMEPNVFDIPIPDPTTLRVMCPKDTIVLQGDGQYNGSWEWFSNPPGFHSFDQNPQVHPDSSIVFYAYVFDSIGCLRRVDSTRVIIQTVSAQINFSNPVCEGDTLFLHASSSYLYQWNGPNGFSSTVSDPIVPNLSLLNTGAYTLRYFDTLYCWNQDTFNIVVHEQPHLVTQVASQVCTRDTLFLSASGGQTYAWSGPNGFTSTNPLDTIVNTVSANSGTYYLTITSDFGCENWDTIPVLILPLPQIQFTTNSPVCASDTLNLGATGGGTYAWAGPGGYSSTSSNPQIINPTISQSGIYHVTVTGTNGCRDTTSMSAFIRPHPQISSVVVTPNNCHGWKEGSIELFINSFPPISYNWACCPTVNQSIINQLTFGSFPVRITNGYNCFLDTTIVLTQPAPFNMAAQVYPDTCRNEKMGKVVINTLSGQTGPYQYLWTTGASTSYIDKLVSSDYYVTITDSHGCDSVFAFFVPFLSDPFIWNTPVSASICAGDPISLSAFGANSYMWSPAGSLNSPNQQTVIATPWKNTTYTVVGTDVLGCHDTVSSHIMVYPLPQPNLGEDSWYPFGDVVTLDAGDWYTYLWSNGSTSNSILVNEEGTYWVKVRNEQCEGSDTIYIGYFSGLYVPNTFTPDGDGLNDQFRVYCESCFTMEMQIFNRWGELVFSGNGTTESWDGSFKGSMCPVDIYDYVIRYTLPSIRNTPEKKFQKGQVLLLR